jgi:hypothetical protein
MFGVVITSNGDDKDNCKFQGWKRKFVNTLRYYCSICEE